MLYKFSSRATANVILLEADGRQILHIIGKDSHARQGIITVEQIPGAVDALKAAMAREAAGEQAVDVVHVKHAKPSEDDDDVIDVLVGLKQRAVPFIDMLQRSAAEGSDVTWGV
ncbi:MAG: DUF1840 domain-containing protein [Comamonas sp.]